MNIRAREKKKERERNSESFSEIIKGFKLCFDWSIFGICFASEKFSALLVYLSIIIKIKKKTHLLHKNIYQAESYFILIRLD